MVARYTSRVFVAAEAIHTGLDAATFAVHPKSGKSPVVDFGDLDPEAGAERIGVVLNPDIPTEVEWARFGPAGRDELLVFDVVIRSFTPGIQNAADLWNRLQSLADVVQGVFYDLTAQAPKALSFDGEVQTTLVTGVRPQIAPTNDGWIGACVVTVRLQATT